LQLVLIDIHPKIIKGFDEILELAERGDNKPVDMLVKDIYGGAYEALELDDELIASSLGKATRSALDQECSREEHLKKFNQSDLMKSILLMICYDLAQIASLHARIHNIKRVYFGGYFIRNSRITMKFLKYGISYWSQVSFLSFLMIFLLLLLNYLN
jgi:bifunctional damage-control phosphatase, subfamily II, fusion protein